MKEFESRSFDFEINAEQTDGNTGTLTGRPIVYDSETDMSLFSEVIVAGALDNADLRDVRFLVNHDVSRIPLARSRNNNGNSTMFLQVDDKGMSINVDLDLNNTDANNLYSAVKRGDISGMSFMFTVADDEWLNRDSDYPTRRIKSIGKVVEVSAVTFPAYEDTEIQARAKLALESASQTLESVRRNSLDNELELEKERFKALQKVRF